MSEYYVVKLHATALYVYQREFNTDPQFYELRPFQAEDWDTPLLRPHAVGIEGDVISTGGGYHRVYPK